MVKIAPSILSADFSAMGDAVKRLERGGADWIHCDVMDGSFVQPITFGGQMVKNIRPLTELFLDVHLMIEHPKTQIKFFADAGADMICVHWEACKKISGEYLKETLEEIKSHGVKCGVAINPDADAECVFGVLPACDMALVMSVFPGYGGQKFMPSSLENVKKIRAFAGANGLKDLLIEVDGGVNLSNCAQIIEAGADVLVAGSAVFGAPDYAQAIKGLRAQ